MTGWICPRCDVVHAPSVLRCECKKNSCTVSAPSEPFEALQRARAEKRTPGEAAAEVEARIADAIRARVESDRAIRELQKAQEQRAMDEALGGIPRESPRVAQERAANAAANWSWANATEDMGK